MLLLEESGIVAGNLGWVDRANIWTYDVASGKIRLVPTGASGYCTLRRFGDLVRVVGHFGQAGIVSIRHARHIDRDLARLELTGGEAQFSGDSDLWRLVDPSILIGFSQGDPKLIHLDPIHMRVSLLDLSWHNDETYDLGYQGLVDSITLPDGQHVLVSVQRSSELIVVNIEKNAKVGEISLAGRSGNPVFVARCDDRLITTDYDTVCIVDLTRRLTVAERKVQEERDGIRHFAGDSNLCATGLCVPRPFSGDVVLLDRHSLATIATAHTGSQPLVAVELPGGAVLGRDWKTGSPLFGLAGIDR
jgi:hypothetical protein